MSCAGAEQSKVRRIRAEKQSAREREDIELFTFRLLA